MATTDSNSRILKQKILILYQIQLMKLETLENYKYDVKMIYFSGATLQHRGTLKTNMTTEKILEKLVNIMIK